MEPHLIDKLGGVKAVADDLGLPVNVVANWKHETRSIPWKRRPALAKIAEEKGVDLPPDFLGLAA